MERDELCFEWSIVDGLYTFRNEFIELFGFEEVSRDLMSDCEPDEFDEKAYYVIKLENKLGWGLMGTFNSESIFEAVAFSPDLAERIWPEQE